MTDLGFICLSLALAATTYSIFASALGINRRDDELVATSGKSVHAATALLSLAVLALMYALLARDFQVEYVANYTSRDLSFPYTLSALWAGQQGSLLFWTWLLSLFASAMLLLHRQRQEPLLPYASLVIAVTEAFFLVQLLFVTNPFRKLDFMPANGLGMNPLLQNPAMLWCPPILYLCYVGFTVPFALTMSALISGRLEDRYLPSVRRWTLFAWLCVGLGTLLGAQWAHVELGWWGYWAWDPVENASLLPWLMSTALIHSLMIQERRRTMKLWNIALTIGTFASCIFGIFVTSSGVASSVHAFGVSSIGLYLLAFLGCILVGSALLLLKQLPELKREREWGSLISRQSSLLLGAVLLAGATLVILLGTLFPPMLEVTKIALTSDYLNWSSVLLFSPLILLMGVCPFLSWRGSTAETLMRDLLIPFISALGAAILLGLLGLRSLFAILAFSICAFVLAGTLLQFYRELRARRQSSKENYLLAFVSMMRRQRRRYGGYMVHLGVVLIAIGVIGSSAYRLEEQAMLELGGSLTIGDYSLRYDDFSFYPAQGKDIASATLSVFEGERQVGMLVPQKHFHRRAQQLVSEGAIHTTLKEDLWVALIDWEEAGSMVALQVIVSPLVVWIWIGGAVLFLGAVIAVWPRSGERLEERIEEEVMRLRQVGGEAPKEGIPQ